MHVSSSEYKERIRKIQHGVKTAKLDAFIATQEENIYYLTGLTYKSLERLFFLVIQPTELTFVLPKMELAHLKSVKNVDCIKHYREYPANEPDRWQDVLQKVLNNCKNIGLGSRTPIEISGTLQTLGFSVHESTLVDTLRQVKSEKEIQLIRRAVLYCDTAIARFNSTAYFGMSELEVLAIAKDIQKRLIKETAFDYLASNVLVAVWPGRISHQPHGIPEIGDRLTDGPHISLAFLRVNGYASELERTFFTRPPTYDERDLFNIMMEVRKTCYGALKAGIRASEIDSVSRNLFNKHGLGNHILHRTGHGIGLGNHEGPYLAEGDSTILQENMVVSIEPGIYIEGTGGFRHSDTVRITRDGYEVLTRCPDSIEDLTFSSFKPYQKIKGVLIRKMFGIS